MIQLYFDEVMCFVDLENKLIYSAKLKKLKPQHLKKHIQPYYMIKYLGKKSYKPLSWLLQQASEKSKPKTGQVL